MSEELKLDFDALEAIARAATPGPWVLSKEMRDEFDLEYFIIGQGPDIRGATFVEEQIAQVCSPEHDTTANAIFVSAADPTTVLELIRFAREADQLRQRVAEYEQAAKRQGVERYAPKVVWHVEGDPVAIMLLAPAKGKWVDYLYAEAAIFQAEQLRQRVAELEQALVYSAFAQHSTEQNMLPKGVSLREGVGGSSVEVRLGDRKILAGPIEMKIMWPPAWPPDAEP
jgi:hypothetical protein